MAEKRALSRHQFAESGFDTSGYAFNEIPGLHTGINISENTSKIPCIGWFLTRRAIRKKPYKEHQRRAFSAIFLMRKNSVQQKIFFALCIQ